jgi:RND family efflux transporter MFP subunit
MGSEPLRTFLHHLRRVIGPGGGPADAQLLERFVNRHDDAAFEVLVWRHGGLVLDVCGRLLRRAEDAEDVFQATFLALARRAGSIGKRESVGSWLYKVAYRLALRVRARAAREATLRQSVPLSPGPVGSDAGSDLRPLLDEEINRLPEKYRAAVVLYYLQGKTTAEAARQLGCARGTICSRLAWARQRLRHRLTRRGLTLGAAGLGVTLAPAAAPAALVRATAQGVVQFASGHAAGSLPRQAVTLAEGVVRAMVLTKVKAAAALVLVLGALGLAARLSAQRSGAEKPATNETPALVRGNGVRLSPAMLAKLGVQVAEVKPRPDANVRVLRLTGTLAVDPDRLTPVRCRCVPAEVIEIGQGKDRPLRVGDRVRKGELLAVLESTEVAAKKLDLFLALAQLESNRERLTWSERMYKKGLLSESQVQSARRAIEADQTAVLRAENALAAGGLSAQDIEAVRQEVGARGEKAETSEAVQARRKRWSRVELTAPGDGTIVERNVNRNDYVTDRAANLFQIARLDRLQVLAQVREADLPALEALKPAERRWDIRPQADPDGPTFRGQIEDLGFVIDLNLHPVQVKGFVENAEGRLRPGQVVTATVPLPPAGEVVLPATAVVEDGGRRFIFVQQGAGKSVFEQRRVSVVRRDGGVVHVRSRLTPDQQRLGLQAVRPGERVVTAGGAELKAILDDLKAGEDR